ncbi:nucleoside deaminase [Ilyomonas limi]|uniref:Nucleoside deaminase n=1 Tax=Ilyomonas limi TaxID=2575867 RepID=A0A4U3L1S1_9BACT|nr:nucleoside deaminase [Ilyomonas limi]TKK68945.1 nucleoside deaminase [Ilyomonas limi]
MSDHQHFINAAVRMSQQGMRNNEGGPFGCVIVKDGEIVGKGNNRVLADNDPTAHAEVVAIRDACKNLHTFQLTGCDVYTSCEPCPMCMGAIYWARPRAVYYANTRQQAAAIGFDDEVVYTELQKEITDRSIPMHCIISEEAVAVFKEWEERGNKHLY